MQSMTGYGKAELNLSNKNIAVELKSLNSKQLDITIKISARYRDHEIGLRDLLSKKLQRGKVELFVWITSAISESKYNINTHLVQKYHKKIKKLQEQIDSKEDILPIIFQIPDVLEKRKNKGDYKEWKKIQQAIKNSVKDLQKSRKKEGEKLSKDIKKRINRISRLLKKIGPLTDRRAKTLKKRLIKKLPEVLLMDENRLEQELVYYIEKQDITEEQVRLSSHLAYFSETMSKPGSLGKKLGFIAQEMGREINTIGSKAGDAKIQKIIVQMKDELEKIKEQLMNIL